MSVPVPKAVGGLVIDHSDRLHESVTDGGTDKFEPGFFQRFGYYIGFGSAGGNLFQRTPLVDDRFAIDELPEIVAETVMLLQNFMESAGIADSCLDLQPVTNDAMVVQHLIDLALVVTVLFDKDAAGQTGFSRRTVELIRERCVKEGLAAVKWKRCWWFTRDRKPSAILLLLTRICSPPLLQALVHRVDRDRFASVYPACPMGLV